MGIYHVAYLIALLCFIATLVQPFTRYAPELMTGKYDYFIPMFYVLCISLAVALVGLS